MKFKNNNAYGTKSSRKGTPNRVNTEMRNAFQKLIEGNLEQMKKDIRTLKAKDRLDVILKMAVFILPKLRQIEMDTTVTNEIDSALINKLLAIPESHYDNLDE